VTAAYEMVIRDRLLNDVVNELCPRTGNAKPARSKSREKTVRLYGERFLDRMAGNTPYKTEEEAISAMAPIAIWLFRWALRQIVIQVVRYLWKALSTPPVVIITKKANGYDYSM